MRLITDFPYDIILEIFKYLDTCDTLSFCNAFPQLQNCINEKQLAQNVDFGRRFYMTNFKICQYLNKTIHPTYIQCLNINSIYWITASELRKCISRMRRLHTLLAIDTQLSFHELDCAVYKKLPLVKLALTVDLKRDFNGMVATFVPKLEKLCLKYTIKYLRPAFMAGLHYFLSQCKNLEELWLMDVGCETEKGLNKNYSNVVKFIPKLKRLIIKSKSNIAHFYLFSNRIQLAYHRVADCDNDFKIVEKKRSGVCPKYTFQHFGEILCDADVTPFDGFLHDLGLEEQSQAWYYLKKKLYYTANEGEIIELNFPHLACGPHTKNIAHFLYRNMKSVSNLRKLKVYSCFLDPKNSNDIFKTKFTNLYELQVSFCNKKRNMVMHEPNYQSIGKLKNLRKLSIEVYPSSTGTFLRDILKNCLKLESLRLLSTDNNYILNDALINSITYSVNLRDLCFVTSKLLLNSLLRVFNEMGATRLVRVFLKCDSISCLNVNNLKRFLDNNPQLIFFIIVIKDADDLLMNSIQDILAIYKQTHSARVFCAVRDNLDLNMYTVPQAHYDLLFCDSNTGFDPYLHF